MCDKEAIANALYLLALEPGFDAESVVNFIYREVEGFIPNKRLSTYEQLRDLLLDDGAGRTEEQVEKILGCTVINIRGGRKSTKKSRVRRHARSTRHK